MKQRTYQHKGRGWQLLVVGRGKVILLTPGGKITLPPFRVVCNSEKKSEGQICQVCEGPDGWQLRIEVPKDQLSGSFSLQILKQDFEVALDAQSALCFDLLEEFANYD